MPTPEIQVIQNVRYIRMVLNRDVDNVCILVDAGENLLKPVSGFRRYPLLVHYFLSRLLGHLNW